MNKHLHCRTYTVGPKVVVDDVGGICVVFQVKNVPVIIDNRSSVSCVQPEKIQCIYMRYIH